MSIKIKQKHEKEIVALNTFEAVRLRPGMYVGNVSLTEEKIPIIRDGVLIQEEKKWSPGFMHLIVEILENALDEAKRMKGKMQHVYVDINTKNNKVTITDTGNGFHKAASKHSKTKKSVVRTAFEELHAGSNFADTESNILGTHGVGAAVVNILSKEFHVETTNRTHIVKVNWKDFTVVKEEKERNVTKTNLGTKVSFIPSPQVYRGFKWDLDLVRTYLSFKQFLIKSDPLIKNLKLIASVDGKNMRLFNNFLPEEVIKVHHKERGTIILWPKYDKSTSVSFINGSLAIGIHQKIVNDWVNEFLDYPYAHHFYDTLVSLNLPSKLMRFGGQNKSKLDSTRGEIEPIMLPNFKGKLIRLLKGSNVLKKIEEDIEARTHDENIKKIKKAAKVSKRKISDKFSPATRRKKTLYITEGLSAAGSVRQARNSEEEGVYALKGKPKNAKRLADLTTNTELIEIMSILGIDPDSKNPPQYSNIVIAADEDPDGQHITSLIINFFQKWFPHIIEEGRLYRLVTPLVVYNMKNSQRYFYTLQEFQEYANGTKLSGITYLKGLGSLSLKDWEHVMDNKVLFKIVNDRSTKKFLDIAFGDSALKRKKWLEGVS